MLDSLDERVGGERSFRWLEAGDPDQRLAWGRAFDVAGSRDDGDTGIYSDEGPAYDYNMAGLQAGMDLYRAVRPDGGFDDGGVYFAYEHASADIDHFDDTDAGTDRLDGWTIGAYWTRFGATGWYIEAVLQGTWHDIEASGRLPAMTTDGLGLGASLEGGYPFDLGDGFVLEPQAQLTYQAIDIEDGRDIGADIRFDDVEGLQGRLSLRFSRTWDLVAPETTPADRRQAFAWMRASLINEFLAQPQAKFSSDEGFIPFRDGYEGDRLQARYRLRRGTRPRRLRLRQRDLQGRFRRRQPSLRRQARPEGEVLEAAIGRAIFGDAICYTAARSSAGRGDPMTARFSWCLLLATMAACLAAETAQAQDVSLPGGATSLREVHGDWVVNCVIATEQERARKICTLSQEQQDSRSRQRVLAVEIGPTAEGGGTGTLVLPFGLNLAAGAILQIDDGAQGQPLPFRTCLPAGCLVSLAVDADMLEALRLGGALKVHAEADGGQKTVFTVSLKGFGGAFDRTASLAQP